ncbi:MAG: response regulator [Saprospiraceae bacterium]|nr:response regulator [Saprospiraceae bacterium]
MLEIVVKDTGPGIPADEQEKIFDRFYQIDGSDTREGEGTGIGLALSREFARLMNGDIAVSSIPENGAAFTLSLPLVIAATPTTIAADSDIEETAILGVDQKIAHNKPGVVLIVEDNTDLRYFIRSAIETNWTVVEASDGEEGVKKAIALIPDLVVSDLMMPRKDGYALCDELKRHELTAHIPVILLTAKAAMDAKLKGLRFGADDYLSKPFHTAELITRIDNLIETRRKLRELWKGDQSPGVAGEAALSGPDLAFIRKFSLLISQHLSDETLGVEEFASKMQISRVQLHRKLKAITGHSATDFIRDYRLERAYALLKNKEGNINEVASLVGFGNEKYFSTVFKEKYGIPPSKVV